jgi:SAM-dependent methyltransferase
MDRTDKILARIPDGGRILEFGPSFAPVVPKAVRENVFTLDHGDQAELRAKYEPLGVDISKIEPVDFVWRGGPIDEAIPSELHGTFDAVIASHVLEHIPDPIRFFQSVGVLLKDGGVLSLANPDQRYCFDLLKPTTTSADLLEAYELKRDRHTRKALHYLNYFSVNNNGAGVWGVGDTIGELTLNNPALGYVPPQPGEDDVYTDCHAWFFTPSSFALIVLELSALGLVPFKTEDMFEPWGCEFYASLVKGPGPAPTAIAAQRLELHHRMREEMQAQIGTWALTR